MESESAPTLENFYGFCAQKKLMGLRCESCKAIVIPPRPHCSRCGAADLRWVQLTGNGKLLTYSVVHVAAPAFQSFVPYVVGIVELTEGPKLPAMIKVDMKDLKVGMDLKVEFESSKPESWPSWVRYGFVRANPA